MFKNFDGNPNLLTLKNLIPVGCLLIAVDDPEKIEAKNYAH